MNAIRCTVVKALDLFIRKSLGRGIVCRDILQEYQFASHNSRTIILSKS